MSKTNIGFIGLGLIGGSMAKVIRLKYPSFNIIAYDINKDNLSSALNDGTINLGTDTIDDRYFGKCDYIFLCTPVSYNAKYLEQLKQVIKSDCIITDVGSVKGNIHQKVKELQLEKNFIGAHPMAGSEKSGFDNSVAHLIENAYYVITPSDKVSKEAVKKYADFVESLGAIVLIMDYDKHDYVTAAISHLPHIIASGLVNFIRENDTDATMKLIAAGGFKDITRIASSSPAMWQHICIENKANITNILSSYIDMLNEINSFISNANEEKIYNFFDLARNYRNSISDTATGPIKKVYEIYCDIIDEAGAISTIATLLANNSISIKNIGIVHNREFEKGVLRIEFYDENSAINAYNTLKQYGYKIYER